MTTIQKLLGHRRLNSTMIYARVHDRTVAEDYYAAMESVEKRLQFVSGDEFPDGPGSDGRAQLLDLVERLAEPQLAVEARLDLVTQMRLVLSSSLPISAGLVAAHGPP